jgi:ribokinase
VVILAYGALNPDVVHRVDRLPGPGDDVRSTHWRITWGGKAANTAVALATWGVETVLTGLVTGTDALGDALVSALARAHLDLSLMERSSSEPTRHCVILTEPDGDRMIICTGYQDARWTVVPPTAWPGVEIAVLDGLSGASAAGVAASARSHSVPVVWLDCPVEHTALADWVVWSSHEHTVAEAQASDAAVTVLTAGAGEVVAFGSGEWRVTPPVVSAVDATGAGDVFAAACARGLLLGWDTERILHWAARAGATLAARGRADGMPTVDQIEATV